MIASGSFIRERIPGNRDLDRAELIGLATEVGQAPALWRHLVRHDPGERIYLQLYRDPHLDVWMICWLDDQKTGYHDHDLSSGAVCIVQGSLCEDYFYRDAAGWIRHDGDAAPARK